VNGTKKQIPQCYKKTKQCSKPMILCKKPYQRKKNSHAQYDDTANLYHFVQVKVAVVFYAAVQAKKQCQQK
jgi:hypothetical protein